MINLKEFSLYGSAKEAQQAKIKTSTKKYLVLIFVFPFLLGNWNSAAQKHIEEKKIVYNGNKIIPENILEEAKIALSHYPELEDVKIEFRYKNNIKNAFMQAQPKISSLHKGKNERSYYVLMSSKLLVQNKEFCMADVPSEVLTGWLGHELGHIVDYLDKSTVELVKFGARYVTSDSFVKKAERTADTHAINNRMGFYIFSTKDFILNHSHFSDSYKQRKARLYLSPQEILAMADEVEKELEELEEEES